jgi:hypothetical protein
MKDLLLMSNNVMVWQKEKTGPSWMEPEHFFKVQILMFKPAALCG